MPFDYDTAREDIYDSGADPDYLDTLNPEKRDAYLRSLGMKPEKYGGGSRDPYYKRKEKQSSNAAGSSDDCFLTSACVRARGLPDDCWELQALREYRDSYLRNRPGGPEEIEEYYRIAPKIVEAVNARPDAREIWEKVYRQMVFVCVNLIQTGKFEKAHEAYRTYTMSLAEEVL